MSRAAGSRCSTRRTPRWRPRATAGRWPSASGVFEDPLFAAPDADQDSAQQPDSLGDASLELLQDDEDLDLGILDDIGLDEPSAAAPPGALPDLPPMPKFNQGDKREAS